MHLLKLHDLLVMGDWHGAHIRDLIRTHLAPFHNLGDNSVLFEGSELKLNPKAAEQIGLALHELGTNAMKHGALSVPNRCSHDWMGPRDR